MNVVMSVYVDNLLVCGSGFMDTNHEMIKYGT